MIRTSRVGPGPRLVAYWTALPVALVVWLNATGVVVWIATVVLAALAIAATIEIYSGTPPRFSVREFGAVGDGVHDDTTAIRRAVMEAQRRGGVVVLPAGTYRLSGGDP